jgi:hypothetical protein
VLANVSTYMTFDDHEVTDDWNITGSWRERVFDSQTGRRVIANALAAYWAFQGWGNDPDNFDKELRIGIERHLRRPPDRAPSAASQYFERRLWGRLHWSYSVPTEPPIVALDTRTQRSYGWTKRPAELIDRHGLDWLTTELLALRGRRDAEEGESSRPLSPIFVVPTPVVGFAVVERLQGMLQTFASVLARFPGARGKVLELVTTKVDIESWISNKSGFSSLMCELLHELGIEHCVFLSGDVHYSFTVSAMFQSDGKYLRVVQCTSSALSNVPHDHGWLDRAARLKGGRARYANRRTGRGRPWTLDLRLEPMSERDYLVTAQTLGMLRLDDGVPNLHRLHRPNRDPDDVTLPTRDAW